MLHSAFQVNTFDDTGDPVEHLGFFPTVAAARVGIAAHANSPLAPSARVEGDGAPIVETWELPLAAYVVQSNA